jgi:hypothetical protein
MLDAVPDRGRPEGVLLPGDVGPGGGEDAMINGVVVVLKVETSTEEERVLRGGTPLEVGQAQISRRFATLRLAT